MNDEQQFEAELKRVAPARPPEAFMARLRAAKPSVGTYQSLAPKGDFGVAGWMRALRWLAAGTVAAVLAAGLFAWRRAPGHVASGSDATVAAAPLKADGVQIDQELVATFDAIGRLPGGEAIRFRCREWVDQVVVRDQARGLVVQERAPRVEVVPVRFETY